jgi:hypothetical protein
MTNKNKCFTFIDKNGIIPFIKKFIKYEDDCINDKESSIDFLMKYSVGKSYEELKNIYVVKSNIYNVNCIEEIYIYKDNYIYKIQHTNKGNVFSKYRKNNNNYTLLNNSIEQFYKKNNGQTVVCENVEINEESNEINEESNEIIDETDIPQNKITDKIDIPQNKIIDINKIDINKIEKEEMEKIIRKMKDELIYEQSEVKNIVGDINIMEKRKKTHTEKYDIARIKNLSNIKNDYKLYKQLNEELLNETIDKIPVLYTNVYKHFEYLLKNDIIKNILDEIYEYDIDKMFITNEFEIEEEVFIFAKNYTIKSKENHLSFEHRWENIEEDEIVNKVKTEEFMDKLK